MTVIHTAELTRKSRSLTGYCATRTNELQRTRLDTSWPQFGQITLFPVIITAKRLQPTKLKAALSGIVMISRGLDILQQQANAAVQAQRDKIREARLRAAWEQLSQAERDAILVVVKDENPGLGRWKNMLEPLCLSALETRMKESGDEIGQQLVVS